MSDLLKLISENVSNIKLTDFQLGTLIEIFSAASPLAARDIVKGNEYSMKSLDFLLKNGFVMTKNSGYSVTEDGERYLEELGIIDGDELTEDGENTLSKHIENKKNIQISEEFNKKPFKTIFILQQNLEGKR